MVVQIKDETETDTLKVLIVDDAPMVRELLKSMVSEIEGVETVAQAEDAKEAISSLKELKPDVVILDIRMPGGNGIEVLKEIKKDEIPCKTIILTGYPYKQYRKKCAELGADYFFDKSTQFGEAMKVLIRLAGEAERSI